ncbi:hypothetical protein IAU60_005639 [Kwoniella sp. DSM 27419]
MPSPPLSPSPHRWRGSPDQPHPAFAALLSSYEEVQSTSAPGQAPPQPGRAHPHELTVMGEDGHNGGGSTGSGDKSDEAEVEFLTAATSPARLLGPEIRTSSPSPDLDIPSEFVTIRRNRSRQRFDYEASSRLSTTDSGTPVITAQPTGASSHSIDDAYNGVLSQLDHLVGSPTDTGYAPTDTPNQRVPPPHLPMPIRQPLVGLGIRMPESSATSPSTPVIGDFLLSRLSTVTERTEHSASPVATPSSPRQSTAVVGSVSGIGTSSGTHSLSPAPASAIASRFALPPSPAKPPRSGSGTAPSSSSGTPHGTPKKASDLIRMFENKGGPPPPQPRFTTGSPSKKDTLPAKASTFPRLAAPIMSPPSKSTRLESMFDPPLPPPPPVEVPTGLATSTVQVVKPESTIQAPNLNETRDPPSFFIPSAIQPTPPRKSPSPLSQVRTMIASWRSRTGSPAQGATGPGEGTESLKLARGVAKGWNVSIRRRKRNERELAEQAEEKEPSLAAGDVLAAALPIVAPANISSREPDLIDHLRAEQDVTARSASLKSAQSVRSEPKQLTGEPIRSGALYYLNVHDEQLRPDYQWVRADGRLYKGGLELSWINKMGKSTVTLDLEDCEEVASTYSPNNPMAGADIGALAAKRQGDLADNLYPFKLVYSDGVERLACDSARERVRWVNAVWTLLEHTRVAPSLSLRANRSTSEQSSDAGGSASTHFNLGEAQSASSPRVHIYPPLYSKDDAIIQTSGGLHAPIVQRGSRHLAVGGPERSRSLRRVASEADLKESASQLLLPEEPLNPAIQDIPLTARTAEPAPSRDFIFAGGIKPPTLREESYFTAEEGSPFLTEQLFETPLRSPISPLTTARNPLSPTVYASATSGVADTSLPLRTAREDPSTRSAYTAPISAISNESSELHTAQLHVISPAGTAAPWSTKTPSRTAPTQTHASTPSAISQQPSSHTARQERNARDQGINSSDSGSNSNSVVITPAQQERASIPRITSLAMSRGLPRMGLISATPNTSSEGYGAGQIDPTLTSEHTAFTDPAVAADTGTGGHLATMPTAYGDALTGDQLSSHKSKSSISSYQTVPPPVPSRDSHYSTASEGPTPSNKSTPTSPSPVRYQLHDAPAPSFFGSIDDDVPQEHSSLDIKTSRSSEIDLNMPSKDSAVSVYRTEYHSAVLYPTEKDKLSPGQAKSTTMYTAQMGAGETPATSAYATVPALPAFRSVTSTNESSDRLTDGLITRQNSRAWTQVSHPDSDDDLLNDLERQSSAGSSVSQKTRSKFMTAMTASRNMKTAQTRSRTARVPLGGTGQDTAYATAYESPYSSAASWPAQSAYYTAPLQESWHTAQSYQSVTMKGPDTANGHITSLKRGLDPEGTPKASSKPSDKSHRVPVPNFGRPTSAQGVPTPSPSLSPSGPGYGLDTSKTPTEASSSVAALPRDIATSTDISRVVNFLQGQEQARSGHTLRLGTQLDRIERKVGQIAENQQALAERDRPPPLPAKGDDPSPPPSPASSVSSRSTVRPLTPEDHEPVRDIRVHQDLDDMRNLLGTILGRQEDLLSKQAELAEDMLKAKRRKNFVHDGSPRMARMEDMLERLLHRIGNSELIDELSQPGWQDKTGHPASHLPTPAFERTPEGSMYDGQDSAYFSDARPSGQQAPANSVASSFDRKQRGPPSDIRSSVIEGSVAEPDFDDEFALAGLPPDTPPEQWAPRQLHVPTHLAYKIQRRRPPAATEEVSEEDAVDDQLDTEREQEAEYVPTFVGGERELSPESSPVLPPIPYRTEEEQYQDDDDHYEEEPHSRGPYRQGPTPQPVDLPTPVNSLRNVPPYQPGMRPGFAPVQGMPAPMPGPGMTDMPRPSLPRIAGVRDPISTTYFRRGFPPAMGPMRPMGMFPGPMGVPGPGMGPFMPGSRPGMPGFGGPMGPNVAPGLRRPGWFPPGVTSTTGDYGLPAGARYGNSGLRPSGPTPHGLHPRHHPPSGGTTTADTGLGNTTTDSTVSTPTTSTPSAFTEEIVTPAAHHSHLHHEPMHIGTADLPPIPLSPSASTIAADDNLRRALGNSEAIAAAQGEQQNEMSRYLHGMSDQIADGTQAAQNRLAEILGDIASLRQQLKPKHIHARVLPDGTVMLDNGDILDGIRGAPVPVPVGVPLPPPPPPTASHVEGKILPDGTVMAGNKIVDGIKAAPGTATVPPSPMTVLDDLVEEEQIKNAEQDQKLAELQNKIEELMQRANTPRDRVYEEEELISMRAHSDSPAVQTIHSTPGIPPTILGTPAPAIGPAPTTVGLNTDIRREKQIIKEREVIRDGPSGRHKEITIENELQRDVVTDDPPVAMVVPVAPATAIGTPVQGQGGSNAGSVPAPRINPRTGKPLTVPPVLSPHAMSPIQPELGSSQKLGDYLMKEEHEEIIHRADGGPPLHTLITTRSYTHDPTRADASDLPATTEMGDAARDGSIYPSRAGSAVQTVGPSASVHPISGTPAAVFSDPALAPGVYTSDHQSVVHRQQANIPTAKTGHGSEILTPLTVPATGPEPQAHPQQPNSALADPSNLPSAGGVPVSNVPPSSVAHNVPSEKPMFDTNHPKPMRATPAAPDVHNVAPEPALLGGSPAHAESNIPAGAPAEAPDMVANPLGTVPSSKGKTAVHWDKLIPHKELPPPPTKSPNASDAPDGSVGPASELHNVPVVPTNGSTVVPTGTTEIKTKETAAGPTGILKKPSTNEEVKVAASAPVEGVPIVPADTTSHIDHTTVGHPSSLHDSDKPTRIADTVHPDMISVPAPATAVPASAKSGPKLKKPVPVDVEHSATVPTEPAGIATATPLGGTGKPGSAKSIPTMQEVMLPDGRTAYIPTPAGSVVGDTNSGPPAGARPPNGIKNGKDAVLTAAQKDSASAHIATESELGKGHCSVCCPNGPRTHAGKPIEPCEHQDGILNPMANIPTVAPGSKSALGGKITKLAPPHSLGLPGSVHPAEPGNVPNAESMEVEVKTGDANKSPGKLAKGKKASSVSPEESAMEDAKKLAIKQKAAAEQAAVEKAARDAIIAEKAAKAKIAEDRHKQNADALANLQKALDAIAADNRAAHTVTDESKKAQDKRRADKTARDKKITDALEKLVAERDEAKKKQASEEKKPGTQAILDALKTAGDGQAGFLRKLATEIMEQNSNQHLLTQQAAKGAAREQIGFNLAGYLDDFSKALSGEVRVLLKEVGDLRESRRALYMELAELLLMKGRQSAGDLMAILPYPAAPPGAPKKEQNQQNQQQGQGKGKAPNAPPAWTMWQPTGIPPVAGRPLPNPNAPPGPPAPPPINLSGGAVPPPPLGGRPLPQV